MMNSFINLILASANKMDEQIMNQMKEIKPRKELVFRIEDKNGNGIYRTEHAHMLYELDDQCFGQAHPHPNRDDKLYHHWDNLVLFGDYRNYYFGFSTMEQLRRWMFDKAVNQKLHDAGIVISIYQTEDYYIGDTQMMFRRSTATLIGKADLI